MAYNDREQRVYKNEFSPMYTKTTLRLVDDLRIISARGKTTTVSGRAVVNTRTYDRSANGAVDEPIWLNIKCIGFWADKMLDSGVKKGSLLEVSGSLFPDVYVNKNNDEVRGLRLDIQTVGVSLLDNQLVYGEDDDYGRDDRGGSGRSRSGSGRSGRSRRQEREPEYDNDDIDGENDIDEDFEPAAPKRSSRSAKSSGGSKRRSRRNVEADDGISSYINDGDSLA